MKNDLLSGSVPIESGFSFHALADCFAYFEKDGLNVGSVFLNPKDILALRSQAAKWTMVGNPLFAETQFPDMGKFVGWIWGAKVFETDVVPPGRVCLLPEGVRGKPTSAASCRVLYETVGAGRATTVNRADFTHTGNAKVPYIQDSHLYECLECSMKPGAPQLCQRCLEARMAAGFAWRGPQVFLT
jgi:hypothetical protein